jgi:hypothetical protein
VEPIDLERVVEELARMPAPRHSSSEDME